MLVFSHGLGGGADLPIPPTYAVVGAASALVITFAVMAVAWRTSRFRGDESGRALPLRFTAFVDSPVTRGLVRTLALLVTAYVLVALVFGQDLLTNPVFRVFFILLWVGLVPLSLLFGPIWTLINPVRIVHLGVARLAGTDPEVGLRTYPARLGYWPAVLGLVGFVWFELVYPDRLLLTPVRFWIGCYAVVMLVGGAVFGTRWFARADPFEVLSSLVARLSPFGRRTDGRIVVRNPLDNLDGLTPDRGLAAVVSVLLGSTAADSFLTGPFWAGTAPDLPADPVLLDTLALFAFMLLVGATLTAATTAATGSGLPGSLLPGLFAHSVVPIIVGYFVAHYLTALLEGGQQAIAQLSDPLSNGSDLLGTADLGVTFFLTLHPALLASIKVAAIVAGHLLAAVAAHDRAVRILPRRHALAGQLPLLLVMIGYTVGGLYLLLST